MALYERLLGRNDAGQAIEGKIRLHGFNAVLAEFARGALTGAQANAAIDQLSKGGPLTASERTEAQTLVNSIAGSATAKLARAKEIDDVLILGEFAITQYDTPTEVKTRLGV